MGISTKVVTLDDTGAGSVNVAPCYFVGASGGATVVADGDNLGTALLTRATAKFVVGEVDVAGTPDTSVALYFDVT